MRVAPASVSAEGDICPEAMDEVLAKLPYKRIPTDIEAVRGSISKLDVKTTEGGAKIITNEMPIPIQT